MALVTFQELLLVDNIESLTVSCDWMAQLKQPKINAIHEEFEQIIQENDRSVSYISVKNISTQITKVLRINH